VKQTYAMHDTDVKTKIMETTIY